MVFVSYWPIFWFNILPVVLSSREGNTQEKKGKDYEITKWEAEIRKSLAGKRPSIATLTKEEKAAVNAQLEKEALIRKRLSVMKFGLERGLHLVRGLILANVPEFGSYLSSVASLLLEGALRKGTALVGQYGFDTYLVGHFLFSCVYFSEVIYLLGTF